MEVGYSWAISRLKKVLKNFLDFSTPLVRQTGNIRTIHNESFGKLVPKNSRLINSSLISWKHLKKKKKIQIKRSLISNCIKYIFWPQSMHSFTAIYIFNYWNFLLKFWMLQLPKSFIIFYSSQLYIV